MIDTPNIPLRVCTLLQNAGFQAFLVGGCVRDSLMGTVPEDWDIATDALPDRVIEIFRPSYQVIPTGIDFGTVTVLVEGESIEVTTFRADGPSSDGRRPDAVTFSRTIEEDLARRDFTCNAIAYDPVTGRIVDPFGGQEDIKTSLIRAVGTPEDRFREDGLRILRAIRFCSTKRFFFDETTAEAIPRCLDMLDRVSPERIRDELLKTLGGIEVQFALEFMQESGVFSKICPELAKQPGLSQNRHHAWEVWEHTVLCVAGERTQRPILRLAVLLHDIAKPATRKPHPTHEGDFQFLGHESLGAEMAETWMRQYKFSNDEIELVCHCILHHLIFFTPEWTDKQLRRWLRKVGEKHLDDLLEVRRADIVGKRPDVAQELEEQELLKRRIVEVSRDVPHTLAHLAIRGNDVMQILGLQKGGPIVKAILDHLLDAVTEDPAVNTREGLTPLVLGFHQTEKAKEAEADSISPEIDLLLLWVRTHPDGNLEEEQCLSGLSGFLQGVDDPLTMLRGAFRKALGKHLLHQALSYGRPLTTLTKKGAKRVVELNRRLKNTALFQPEMRLSENSITLIDSILYSYRANLLQRARALALHAMEQFGPQHIARASGSFSSSFSSPDSTLLESYPIYKIDVLEILREDRRQTNTGKV